MPDVGGEVGPVRVLVVEDEQRLAALLVQALTEEDWHATAVHTGADGLAAVRDRKSVV